MSLPFGSVSTSWLRGTRGPSRASSSTSALARANSVGVNGRYGRSTVITPPSGARSRITVSSRAPSTGTGSGRRLPTAGTAGRDRIVHRPSNCRNASGSSAASRAVRVARPSTRVGASTRSWASARSIHVPEPPAAATAPLISSAAVAPGARSRNSSTVPSASGCVWRLRMSTRSPASAAHSAASEPGSSFTVVRIRHSAPSRDPGAAVSRACSDGPARSSELGRASVSLAGGA